MSTDLIPRRSMSAAIESLTAFRAVVVQGARQVGKSTLAGLLARELDAPFVTLDREEDLSAARDDPSLFLDGLGRPAVIDELQRAGDPLVLAVKQRLDASRAAGQYVLTGSTNFLTTPTVSESLAGRIDLITLWPLSMGELLGGADDLIDRAFRGSGALLDHRGDTPARRDYIELVCRGGYPEVQPVSERLRRRWFERYVETVLRREVETAADLRRFDALQAMARLLLATTGSELVTSRLAERLGLDRATAQSYEPWIETTFLVHRVPAWSRNVASKIVHRPKLHACDTGLAAAIMGKGPDALARPNDPATGPLVESFVVTELAKQLTWSQTPARLHHFRDREGHEVDAIIEASDGRVVAVEIKASTLPRASDATAMAGIRDRLDRLGADFTAGIVIHTGDRRVSLGDRLVGLPLADLWT
ncbi:MAG: ATP-binding protein [Actinobacteria bacterium]|nr:ATP-binding protein [Actinomycetota bacterium]